MGFIDSTPQFRFPTFDGKEYLTEEELKKISVLFEPLFPANHDQGIPGANDAKAPRFLSCLLALSEDEYYKISEWRKSYRKGLKLLDKAAQEMHDKNIKNFFPAEAKTFLESMEEGKLKGLPDDFNQRAFFKMMLEHCIKGCFADPRWGGNENGIMWRWLGWVQPATDINFKRELA